MRVIIDAIGRRGKGGRPDLDNDLFDFLRDILRLSSYAASSRTELVMRFQQLTGPVMAKGVEDTAFYCFNRLVSLNEVGGDPGSFGLSLKEFHTVCREAQAALAARDAWLVHP